MALYVNTNVSSLNAQRQLMNSGSALDTAFKRLSSGFRINSAADDAAGLQISDRLTSQITGLNQAARNANDGISLSQVAEGAMDEITTSLQRMRELVIQAGSGVNGTADFTAIGEELTELKAEVDRVVSTTKFGDVNLLNTGDTINFLVGANGGADETISIALDDLTGMTSAITNPDATTTPAQLQVIIDAIDTEITDIGSFRAQLGAKINRFQATIRNLSNVSENVSESRSRIRDTDFAKETAELTRAQILQQTSNTVLAQANQRPQGALSLLQG